MITQCEIRKLYGKKSEPGVYEAIELAKTFERRRCGHHPDQFPEPLSTHDCMSSVVDPKQNGENKHRYVVATQSQEVRRMLRGVRAVPLIYIKRSVMVLEPMADQSVQVRAREERAKFRAEIKPNLGKRKREGEDDKDDKKQSLGEEVVKKPKKTPGVKGPNPLSVKKPKKKDAQSAISKPTVQDAESDNDLELEDENPEKPAKKIRRGRRRAKKSEANGDDTTPTAQGTTSDNDED